MIRIRIPFAIVIPWMPLASFSFYEGQNCMVPDRMLQDTSKSYMDGTYEGKSRAKYTGEPFWGIIHLTIENGSSAFPDTVK